MAIALNYELDFYEKRRVFIITRVKTNAQYESISILSQSFTHRDTLVRLGTGYQGNPILNLPLVEIRHGIPKELNPSSFCLLSLLTIGFQP